MMDGDKAHQDWVNEVVTKAKCRRQGYNTDRCALHFGNWPYDEAACNVVYSAVGVIPRRYLGDGRAEGKPRFPRQ